MLYFLLALIAVGALLASEEGKKILGGLIGLAFIAGLLFVGFWAVVFGIALVPTALEFLKSDTVDTIFSFLAFVVGAYFAIIVSIALVKKIVRLFKSSEERRATKHALKKWWRDSSYGIVTILFTIVAFWILPFSLISAVYANSLLGLASSVLSLGFLIPVIWQRWLVRKYKILFVDDDEFLRDMYAEVCKKAGLKSVLFSDASGDFVKRVARAKPDLISLDVVMPGIDGFEAIQLLKKDSRTKQIPVFFLTNLGQEEDIERGMSLGAQGYLICAQLTPAEVIKKYKEFLLYRVVRDRAVKAKGRSVNKKPSLDAPEVTT